MHQKRRITVVSNIKAEDRPPSLEHLMPAENLEQGSACYEPKTQRTRLRMRTGKQSGRNHLSASLPRLLQFLTDGMVERFG